MISYKKWILSHFEKRKTESHAECILDWYLLLLENLSEVIWFMWQEHKKYKGLVLVKLYILKQESDLIHE